MTKINQVASVIVVLSGFVLFLSGVTGLVFDNGSPRFIFDATLMTIGLLIIESQKI